MNLIQIAHRGEAQEFIRNLDLKSHPELTGLYTGEKIALLITGEGMESTLAKVSLVLGMLKIKKIINFGIAGSLNKDLVKGHIYTIRTSYGFNSKPLFKSFTTNCSTTIDCITSSSRVLNKDYANKLSNFAAIVDRELWSVGFAAKIQSIPFESYKLISDMAGEDSDCFDIKNKALEYSEQLYTKYTELSETEVYEFIFNPPMAMSFTHKKKFEKLMTIVTKKQNITESDVYKIVGLSTILELKIKEKEKINKFLNAIEVMIDPINSIAREALEKEFSAFTNHGCKIKYDQKLENQSFSLQVEINSQTNLDKLKRSIDIFDFKKIQDIWSGRF